MVADFDHVRLGPEEIDSIRYRREALSVDGDGTRPLTGLALSGGGIRSATFALGLLQGMARAEWLDRIDVLSTVSGGGYAGAFLRSLFIPRLARFRDPGSSQGRGIDTPTPEQYRQRHDWAIDVLKAPSDMRRLGGSIVDEDAEYFAGKVYGPQEGDKTTANPVWWLREHGRYLAPNGSGDYLFALSYIVRGWFAMQYVALIPLISIFLGFKLLGATVNQYSHIVWPPAGSAVAALIRSSGPELSPLMLVPAALLAAIVMPLSTTYWLTATLTQWRFSPIKAAAVTLLLAVASIVALCLMWLGIGGDRVTDSVLRLGGYFVYVQLSAAAILLVARCKAGDPRDEIYPSELRRVLTGWLATAMKAVLFCFTLAIVDSFALNLVHLLRTDQPGAVTRAGSAGGIGAIIVSVIVWLVQKAQAWLPRLAKVGQSSWFVRLMPGLILACGLLAYGIIATLCAAIGYLLVWDGIPFHSSPTFLIAAAALALTVLLTLVTGLSPRFLNLSSLHYFYAGRLTRAYLGASNARRLAVFGRPRTGARAANVQEYDEGDALCLADYHRKEVLAPVHLINVTANETEQADSQLVQRDRKGNNLCVGPGGISLDGKWRTRAELAAQDAERLAIGKWIAISGAAASSGMGQATTIGSALLLTFANVRLGYWWYAPELAGRIDAKTLQDNVRRHHAGLPKGGPRSWRVRDIFETQSYLLCEAVAAYSRVGRIRLNLSDGGHFENSGAYELIRRRLPLIIISDAAADPHYEFEDFGNLVRKARIDLGAEVRCLDREELEALPADIRKYCGLQEDFRKAQSTDMRCLIVCRVDYEGCERPGLLLLIKPRVPFDAPMDVAVYHHSFATFPQEPTVDQFFGEAQWESYRCLGEMLGRRLFPVIVDALLDIAAEW